MKTKYLSAFAALAMAACVSSCSDDSFQAENIDEGKLNTSSIIPEVTNAEIIISDQQGAQHVASRRVTDLTNYLITVENSRGEAVANWTYSTMPQLPVFPVGTYTIKVASCEEVPAAWEAPLFLGQQTFEIRKGEVTDVQTVVCKLANIAVSVICSDDLVAASAGDINVTVTSKDEHSLTYTPSDTRRGYFQAMGQTTLEVHFTGTVNGHAEDFRYLLKDVAAGQHRKVNFSLRTNPNPVPGEYGDITNDGEGISVSTSVTGEDLTSDSPVEEEILPDNDRPGQEENPDEPNPPTPPTPGDWKIEFTSKTVDLKLDGVNDPTLFENDPSKEAVVIITSTKGFKNLKVDIISTSLNDEMLSGVGLAGSFDLATGMALNPKTGEELDRDLSFALGSPVADGGFGFPVKDSVTGEGINNVEFNITSFVPLLNIYKGELHQFKITVVDKDGNSKDMTLEFQS